MFPVVVEGPDGFERVTSLNVWNFFRITGFNFLQKDLHPPAPEVPLLQVPGPRDAQRDGGAKGAEEQPAPGFLQLQEGKQRSVALPGHTGTQLAFLEQDENDTAFLMDGRFL